MNTSQSASQSLVLAEAAAMLAHINPAAFATRPRSEALAAVRAAIAKLPRSSSPAACQALARKAQTANALADKLEAAEQYSPAAFTAALIEHGTATRGDVVDLLREYFRAVKAADRLETLRAATAAKRCAQADEQRAGAAKRAAKQAAQPAQGAPPEENAKAAAGYARLKAAGAFD